MALAAFLAAFSLALIPDGVIFLGLPQKPVNQDLVGLGLLGAVRLLVGLCLLAGLRLLVGLCLLAGLCLFLRGRVISTDCLLPTNLAWG